MSSESAEDRVTLVDAESNSIDSYSKTPKKGLDQVLLTGRSSQKDLNEDQILPTTNNGRFELNEEANDAWKLDSTLADYANKYI